MKVLFQTFFPFYLITSKITIGDIAAYTVP